MNALLLRCNRQLLFLVTASLLATVPVWIPYYPMMVDLPQHASEIALLRNLGDSSFRFSGLFEHYWFTPYWLGYLLAYILTPLTGIRIALKLVVCLALASFPIATAFLIREMKGDVWWAWLSIPGMYGFAYQWGLLNFLVAVPVGLLFLALVARHARTPSRANSWLLAASAVALFFCHALICAIFGLIAVLYIFCESNPLRTAIPKVVPLLSPLPFVALYLIKVLETMAGAPAMPSGWDLGWFKATEFYYSRLSPFRDGVNGGWGRINGFFPRLLGIRPSFSCILAGLILFALPLLSGAKLSRRLGLWMPIIVLTAALLFLPNQMLGNAYTYQRLTLLALPFFALIWIPQENSGTRWRLSRIVTVALAFTWIFVFAMQMRAFDAEQAGFRRILDEMAPKERVLSLILNRESGVGIAPPFLHFPTWYAAEKGGLVDPSFAFLGIEPVRFREGSAPPATPSGFEWFPGRFEWNRYRGYDYRYFVVRFHSDAAKVIFRTSTCTINLVDHIGEWWLYEKDSQCTVPAAVAANNRQPQR
jgi:hypothetical protein